MMSDGIPEMRRVERIRLDKRTPIISDYTICPAMCGKCAAIGSALIITKTARKRIRKVPHPVRHVCCAAEAGPTIRSFAERLFATTEIPTPEMSITASDLFSFSDSPCNMQSLSLWGNHPPHEPVCEVFHLCCYYRSQGFIPLHRKDGHRQIHACCIR